MTLTERAGRNIREAREAIGWTRRDLADAIGSSPQRISNLENGGGGLSIHALGAIAEALGCEPGELLT